MKIAVIGGGSTYTPELIEGLIRKEGALGLERVVLQDIDRRRLTILTAFSQRMAKEEGAGFAVESTPDLDKALDGADFVITQFRVGGQAARHRDIRLCLRHDLIGQETVGIGGFAKALRTIPVMLEICASIEKHAPKAWLINFTNPSGLVTEAVLTHTRVKAVGLCNIPMEMRMLLARSLGVKPGDIRFDYVGLNHLGWIRRVFVKGRNVTEALLGALLSGKKAGPANIPDISYDPGLVRALGMVPQYYLRYYYSPGRMLRTLKAQKKDRAQVVMEIEKKLMGYYADEKNSGKPGLLDKRGGAYYSRAAVELIDAIANDKHEEHIVNVRNGTATPDLPPGAVMEVPSIVGRHGASPRPVGAIEPQIIGLIRQVKAFEQLTIRAVVARDYGAALLAVIAHPLGPSAEGAQRVLADVIRTNALDLRTP